MTTLQDLRAKQEELRKQQEEIARSIEEFRSSQRAGVIAEIKAMMAQHGLTVSDLETPAGRGQPSRRRGQDPRAVQGRDQVPRCRDRLDLDRPWPEAALADQRAGSRPLAR